MKFDREEHTSGVTEGSRGGSYRRAPKALVTPLEHTIGTVLLGEVVWI